MRKIKRIIAVTGIRSEYDILYPVIKRIKDCKNYDLKLVVSGAHLSDWHGSTLERIAKDGFEIADCVDSLLSTNRTTQRSKAVAMLISGLTQTIEREKPDFLLVVGDREESIATAIVGNYMDVLVAHIGGGDPVWGNADDPIRMAVSKLSHIHFTTAMPYSKNLINMGEDTWRIKFCGTPGLDNINNESILSKEEVKSSLEIITNDYIVMLKHPLSSESESIYSQMEISISAVNEFCKKRDLTAVCITPNSDPGSYEIVKAYQDFSSGRLILKQTLPRNIFINLMRHSKALVGNSSMGILEAPMYKLPVVNIGNRQRGRLNAGNVMFVDYCKGDIISALEQAVFDDSYRKHISSLDNPYGKGEASKVILNFLETVDLDDASWHVKKKLVQKNIGNNN